MPDSHSGDADKSDICIDELADNLFDIMATGKDATLIFETEDGLTEKLVLEAEGLNDQGGFCYRFQVYTPLEIMSPHCAAMVEAIMMADHQKAIAQLIGEQ